MNPLLVLASLLLATPTAIVAVDVADGDCFGTPCDQINKVCYKAFGNYCLGYDAEADATGPQEPQCIDQEPYSRWCGNLLAAVDNACYTATGASCWDDGTDGQIQCLAVDPWYAYCSAVVGACKNVVGKNCFDQTESDCAASACETINVVCRKVGGYDCVAREDVAVDVPRCNGAPCDAINAVCHAGRKVLPDPCVK